ncbi:MazG family protein [Occultella aeris]|uniref:Nucleoside triphosphate pyrophosphohydrolase/pyrophosphatase MazG n=1 Tax=Occultella aeris TaxID=2761496 RepID=A0A7M4DJ23_9MICO|nr:MazG family protein [Occultella aeris]VZO37006.1 Nucleoside triphosphate pyrophosphohydrolase/pyrophosphatase MazG [Occultella aeris]
MSVPGPGEADRPGGALLDAVAVMDRLRSPGGCPWDAEQTHASLAPYAIEEAHEVAEAAESGDAAALQEELGDLLLQVLFHARVATEASDGVAFDIDDVARTLVAKLVRRHPHVFAADAGAAALTPADVNRNWDAIKAQEKVRESILDGIPPHLPALARAQKVLGRARKAGLEPDHHEPAPDPASEPAPSDIIGAALLELVRRADAEHVDAEAALRAQTRALEARIRAAERDLPL